MAARTESSSWPVRATFARKNARTSFSVGGGTVERSLSTNAVASARRSTIGARAMTRAPGARPARPRRPRAGGARSRLRAAACGSRTPGVAARGRELSGRSLDVPVPDGRPVHRGDGVLQLGPRRVLPLPERCQERLVHGDLRLRTKLAPEVLANGVRSLLPSELRERRPPRGELPVVADRPLQDLEDGPAGLELDGSPDPSLRRLEGGRGERSGHLAADLRRVAPGGRKPGNRGPHRVVEVPASLGEREADARGVLAREHEELEANRVRRRVEHLAKLGVGRIAHRGELSLQEGGRGLTPALPLEPFTNGRIVRQPGAPGLGAQHRVENEAVDRLLEARRHPSRAELHGSLLRVRTRDSDLSCAGEDVVSGRERERQEDQGGIHSVSPPEPEPGLPPAPASRLGLCPFRPRRWAARGAPWTRRP